MLPPLLTHCPETLPAKAYLDPAWFRREQVAIWGRNWVAVGRLADLAPGTMRRARVGAAEVILCRDRDGTVAAFHNVYRHRGAELCSAPEQAMGRLITCPYHAWSYASDGRLISTAHATPTEDFRKEDNGLLPVHVRLWAGFMLLCTSAAPPPLAPDLGLDALDHWPMDALVTGHRMVRDLACNWKVFWENYNECLHCPGIHPELCDMVPVYRQGIMAPQEAAGWTPDSTAPAALKPGAVTWTADGQPCGPEFPGLTPEERERGFTFVTLYPTMYVVAHVDHLRAVRLEPVGPEATRLVAEWYFPPETPAQPGFDAAAVARFATLVMDQDAAAAEMNQRGLRSPAYARGRLMPQEFDIHRFHGWVLDQLATGDAP